MGCVACMLMLFASMVRAFVMTASMVSCVVGMPRASVGIKVVFRAFLILPAVLISNQMMFKVI